MAKGQRRVFALVRLLAKWCFGRLGKLVSVGDCEALADALSQAAKEERIEPPKIAWKRYSIVITVDKYLAGIDMK